MMCYANTQITLQTRKHLFYISPVNSNECGFEKGATIKPGNAAHFRHCLQLDLSARLQVTRVTCTGHKP